MKSFPTNFTIEKNKKTGASPVWILKCPFATGTIYLSDQSFAISSWNGGITTKSWVSGWGALDEDITGELATPKISDITLNILIDPNASPSIHDILWNASNSPETTDCELYLWFLGLNPATDPPQKFATFNIYDYQRLDELHYQVQFIDQSVRRNKYIGEKIDLSTYPNADPDDVGKVAPIIYGAVTKVPARIVDGGAITSLPQIIDVSVATFNISDPWRFAVGKTIQIDAEEMYISGLSGDAVTVTRGYNSSTAAIHLTGAVVWEKKTTFVYLWANHPVKSIGKILGRVGDVELDITNYCTKYTGHAGNELSGYSGRAVITLSALPSLGNILINIIDPEHNHGLDTGGSMNPVYSATYLNGQLYNDYLHDDNWTTSPNIIYINHVFSEIYGLGGLNTDGKTPVSMYVKISAMSQPAAPTAKIYINGNFFAYASEFLSNEPILLTKEINVSDWNDVMTVVISSDTPFSSVIWLFEVQVLSVNWTYTATLVAQTGISANSVANMLVGDQICISGEGYQDDASGTFTGTPNALITRPDHVIKHFLYTQCAWPLANFYTNAATPFAADGYAFAGVINEYKQLKEWLTVFAFQCRCYFRFTAGIAQLLYRPDSITSAKTITKYMIRMNEDGSTSAQGPKPSPLREVINKINLHFDRDWSQSGADAYKGLSKDNDITSIGKYGEKEQPELFLFDFVTLSAMADDVRAFYLARYKDRKKEYTLDCFLDNSELEFADGVTLTPQGSVLCEVQKVNIYPGSGTGKRNDKIILTVREY